MTGIKRSMTDLLAADQEWFSSQNRSLKQWSPFGGQKRESSSPLPVGVHSTRQWLVN